MRHTQVISITLLVIFSSLAKLAIAVPSSIFMNQEICTSKKELCLRGSLYFDDHQQQLSFSGRIVSSTYPGRLNLKLFGTDKNGKTQRVELTGHLQGKYSEIVNLQKSTPKKHPLSENLIWQVESLRYQADQ